jgi:hypothetical protein
MRALEPLEVDDDGNTTRLTGLPGLPDVECLDVNGVVISSSIHSATSSSIASSMSPGRWSCAQRFKRDATIARATDDTISEGCKELPLLVNNE